MGMQVDNAGGGHTACCDESQRCTVFHTQMPYDVGPRVECTEFRDRIRSSRQPVCITLAITRDGNMDRAKVLIVEDERLAIEAVRQLLERDAEVDIVGTARDGATAVSLIRRLKPDIVFLDVQIPELDAFGVIDEIGVENMPVVVFVTAYDRYTLQAFEVHAVDY